MQKHELKSFLDVVKSYIDKANIYTLPKGLSGSTALVLYYFIYEKYFNNIYSNNATDLLKKELTDISTSNLNYSIFSGLTGVGWMIDYLSENNFIDPQNEYSFNEDTERYIHNVMLDLLFSNNYDYHHGSSGLCHYFAGRYNNSIDPKQKNKYYNYIIEYLFFLEKNRINEFKCFGNIFYKQNERNNIYFILKTLNYIKNLGDFDPILMPILEDIIELLISYQNNLIPPQLTFQIYRSNLSLNNVTLTKKLHRSCKLVANTQLNINDFLISSLNKKLIYNGNDIDTFQHSMNHIKLNDSNVGFWNGVTKTAILTMILYSKDIYNKQNWFDLI